MSIAPPSGPGSVPSLPAPLTQPTIVQPSIATVPPVVPPPGASTAGQAVLSLTARYGKDLPFINNGLVWRVFADKPDDTGTFKLIREERGATPNIVLPPGNYVVHVALGLVSAVRTVSLKSETDRESFILPAGGLRFEGRVGTSKIPQNQISFALYKGSQFEGADRGALVPNVAAGDVALLPEGTYYIISNYGDANSVVRSDIRVQAGKLTDVTITHRAAVITLKLVSDKGGEALANTAWSVITPGGDVIKESIGAFPAWCCPKASTAPSPRTKARYSSGPSTSSTALMARSKSLRARLRRARSPRRGFCSARRGRGPSSRNVAVRLQRAGVEGGVGWP